MSRGMLNYFFLFFINVLFLTKKCVWNKKSDNKYKINLKNRTI